MVTLAEDLYLLADESGRPLIDHTHLDLGLGGALLLDLALHDRVALVDAHVTVVDKTPTGDALLDAALRGIAGESRAYGPDHWVRHLARRARHAVQGRLVDAGVLRRDDHRVLGVIPMHRTRETDGRLHHELVDHLHNAVVLGHPPSRDTAALASLALAVGLTPHLFPRSDRRAITNRMVEVAAAGRDGGWVATAVAGAVNAVDATMGIIGPGSDAFP
jgi:hypothetical protein